MNRTELHLCTSLGFRRPTRHTMSANPSPQTAPQRERHAGRRQCLRNSVLRRHTKGADDTAMVTVAFLGERKAVRDQLRRASTLLPKQNPVESSILPSRLTLRRCPRLVPSVAPFRSTIVTHLETGILEFMWGPPRSFWPGTYTFRPGVSCGYRYQGSGPDGTSTRISDPGQSTGIPYSLTAV